MHSAEEYKKIINSHLYDYLPILPKESAVLSDAMRYSLEVGGKRLRPTLLLAACEYAGGRVEEALPYACAVEYIHTYSLIHDDLPAMDNDDLRRGKPTNHKVFGETLAILAGDALLSQAAEVMTREPLKYKNDSEKLFSHIMAANEIISRAGAGGMVAGQTADVTSENTEIDAAAAPALVEYIERHKTADLITAPVRAGLILAGADDSMLDAFTKYAVNIGISFQILDDILDIEGDPELMGKTLGKDSEEGKLNYAFVHGIDKARSELHRLTEQAKASISDYPKSDFFVSLAEQMETRSS